MSNMTINQRVKNVLIENLEEGGSFMSLSQIAKYGYGEAYIKDTQKALTDKVKRAMPIVIKDLENQGLIVLKDRAFTMYGKKLTHNRILGYKIFSDSNDDRKYLDNHRLNNAERFSIAKDTIRSFDIAAFKLGLIEKSEVLRLDL